jgi:hypothetical protein
MAKSEKTIKLAIIRGEDVRECPFGLPIIDACKYIGDGIHRMAPLDAAGNDKEEKEKIKKANNIVYAYQKTGERCPYADKLLETHNKVDCDFGDTGEGFHGTPFRGSPLYPQTFHGIGLDGLYGYPLGFYADNNESRNLFFGLFSFLGHNTVDELVKLADTYDKKGESDKADIVDNLVNKLQDIRNTHKEAFDKIEKYLAAYRDKYEANRADTGLLWQLSDAWFGPRQVNR